ncbi:MAG TPA: hypothetical protein VGE74_26470 [Gemmata sp.]
MPKHLMPKGDGFNFPAVVGTTWVYEENGTNEVTLTISKVETKDGAKLVTAERVEVNGVRKHYMTWSVSEKGIFLVSELGSTYPVPWCICKLPHKEGDTWKTEGHGGDMTAGPVEKAKTAAGEIRAYRVDWDLGPGNTVHYWYAPGFGLVRQQGSPTWALKSFTKGKE